MGRIREAEARVAKGSGWQESAGDAFLLNRAKMDLLALERVRKAVPSMDDFAGVDNYMRSHPALAEAAASRASTTRAISSAQRDPIAEHLGRTSPRGVMNDVLRGTGSPEPLETYEVQVRKLRKSLADATSPGERERYGYELTRLQLLELHRSGQG